ncbi:MAG: hypothetical protein ACLFNC_05050 [Halodesulfurarchaeum sp.]
MSRNAGDSSDDPEAIPNDTAAGQGAPAAGPNDFAPAKLEPGLRREFLLQAGLLNGGVLAVGAGLVLLAFTEKLTGGVLLIALGVILLLLSAWRYRRQAPGG